MKHNYHIKVDPPMPSEETIAKHKDFNHVLQGYQKFTQPIYRKPLYKNPKAFLGLLLIITIGYLVFEAVDEERKLKGNQQQQGITHSPIPDEIVNAEVNSFLKEASPTLSVPVQRFEMKAEKATTLWLADSTQLIIPENAFSLGEWQTVKGPVDLQIRVLRDPVDFSLVGLPVISGDGSPLRPSVAIEIQAFSERRSLQMTPGTKIQVKVPFAAMPADAGLELSTLDFYSHKWKSSHYKEGVVTAEAPSKGPKLKRDGFGVVEFDQKGKQVKHQVKEDAMVKSYLQTFFVHSLGIHAVTSSGSRNYTSEAPVRFKADGQPLKLFSVYGIAKGSQQTDFFWPIRADFTFMLRWNKAAGTTFYGFLPDGRVAWVNSAEIEKLKIIDEAGADLPVQVSPAPVTSKTALMQLLGI